MIVIHTNPKIETILRKHNFEIPEWPKQGNILWFEKLVGKIDNFNGIIIEDESAAKYIKSIDYNIPIWNTLKNNKKQ